jgi:SH3-like domain-containing protein
MSDIDLVDLRVAILAETDLAWRVEDEDGVIAWVPKSQSEFDSDTNTLTVPEWLAIDKGFV